MSDKDILSDYLQGLFGIEPLDKAEEHRLSKLIQEGDEDALDKLVTHNLRLVVYIVTKLSAWQYGKVPVEDIIAMGNMGLILSAKKWKPTKNNGFASYAGNYVRRYVTRELDNTANTIRLPVNITEQIKKMNYTERSLTQVLGRKPKTSEVASVAGMSVSKVNRLRGFISREPVSLDALMQDKFLEELED